MFADISGEARSAGAIDTENSTRGMLRHAAVAAEPVPFQEEMMQDRKKIRILIIDDDDTFRELASMLLAEAGYAIETAEDAIEGGKALLTRNFDLVISDINMPEFDRKDGEDNFAVFSPDSRHVAYAAKRGKKWRMVLDGQEIGEPPKDA